MTVLEKVLSKTKLWKSNDYHIIEFENTKFIFFPETLQFYKLDNPHIIEFIQVCESNNETLKSYLTTQQFERISEFIQFKLDSNPNAALAYSKKGINSIVLNVAGTKCNLNCKYCFAFTDKSYDLPIMDEQTAIKAIDFLTSKNPDEDFYGVVFFGGEPFINYKLITEVVHYCNKTIVDKLGKSFTLSATTNGTILNKQLLKIFQKHPSEIYISLDGPERIHNGNRPFHNGKGSYNKVMANVNLIKEHNIKYSFRPTITSDCNNLIEIIDFFEKQETRFYFEFALKPNFKFSESTVYTMEKLEKLEVQYSDLIRFYFEKVMKNENIFCDNVVTALRRIYFRQSKDYACAGGRNSITVNSDRTIYSCQSLSNIYAACIGTLDTGIDENKLMKFVAPVIGELKSCTDCWIRNLCCGGCFAEKYIENINLHTPIKVKCELKKMQWEKYLILYQKIVEQNPKYLENIRLISKI